MKIRVSKSQWELIGKKSGWDNRTQLKKRAQLKPEFDMSFQQGNGGKDSSKDNKIEKIKNMDNRPEKIKSIVKFYAETHPWASHYELNTVYGDICKMPTEFINNYIEEFASKW